jgi:hypothetical protein
MALGAGCFGKPGFSGTGDARLDGSGGDDAMPDACTGAWGNPSVLHELDGLVVGEPTITADLKAIYFSTMVGGRWEIHYATRNDPMEPFIPQGHLSVDPGSMVDQDPSVTSDGRLIVFRATMQGAIQQAEDTGSGFVVGNVPGLIGLVPDTLDLSGDGNTLYFMKNGALHVARRTQRSMPFAEDTEMFGTDLHWPAVTGDGTLLYYTMTPNTYGVYEATRTSVTAPFTGAAMILDSAFKDADVTDDGAVMVVAQRADTTAAILRRGCP